MTDQAKGAERVWRVKPLHERQHQDGTGTMHRIGDRRARLIWWSNFSIASA